MNTKKRGRALSSSPWHLDKRISVGHILSTGILAVSAMAWASKMEQMIVLNAQSIQFLQTQQAKDREHVETLRVEIREDFKAIHGKLDQLLRRER